MNSETQALFPYHIFFTGRRIGAVGCHYSCAVRVAAPNACEALKRFQQNAASEHGYEYGPGYCFASAAHFTSLSLGGLIVKAIFNNQFNDSRMARLSPKMEAHAKNRPNSLVSLIAVAHIYHHITSV